MSYRVNCVVLPVLTLSCVLCVLYVCMYVCMYVCLCVCVCVCGTSFLLFLAAASPTPRENHLVSSIARPQCMVSLIARLPIYLASLCAISSCV